MVTSDQLDDVCVLLYKIVNVKTFSEEEIDFLDEVLVHAEDIINTTYNEEDIDPDIARWEDEGGDGYGIVDSLDEYETYEDD